MQDHDFELLTASIKEAGEIRKGSRKAARVTTIAVPEITAIRARRKSD